MTTDASPLFVLVAGEASGDLLGADLIAGLRKKIPGARFAGIGGPRMAAAGMQLWHAAEKLSVMGFVEVIAHLPSLFAVRRDLLARTLRERPAAFIGIDAPDFNLGIERKLKQAGIRTIHYVSPSIWAWREKRADKIAESAERVLCLFPMEPPIYAKHRVDARFVGHPLARAIPLDPDHAGARRELGIADDAPLLALLPGSRLGEIKRLGKLFFDAAAMLKRQLPTLEIVVPAANAACRTAIAAMLAADPKFGALNVRLIDGNARTAMLAADAILLASGTAALEAMLAKRPMAVAYRVNPFTYWIVKKFGILPANVYSLPNILAGRTIVPELMQDDCTAPALTETLLPLLRSRQMNPDLAAEFRRLHETLIAEPDSAASAVVDLLERHTIDA
ncbi:MAG TPA: lipid-A-disaccharide synthase [Rudaea sp.]|jgi:lipid-A-disaccharide synthase|nr:lipid-A-disaccharide synthase [Rudaea sp.]